MPYQRNRKHHSNHHQQEHRHTNRNYMKKRCMQQLTPQWQYMLFFRDLHS